MKITKRPKLILSAVIIFTAAVFSGCYYDKSELLYPNSNATVDCGLISSKFAADVNPIIQSKCAYAGCHDGNNQSALLNYSQISAKQSSINTRALVEKSMPPGQALSIDEISKIKCWITSGVPNN